MEQKPIKAWDCDYVSMTAAPKLDRSFILFYFSLKIDFKDPNKLMQQYT